MQRLQKRIDLHWNIVNSMPAQHIFTTEVKQVVIMMSQTQIKFLMKRPN